MTYKIGMAMSAGFIYFIFEYAMVKYLFAPLHHYEYFHYGTLFFYYAIPFLLAAAIIIILKERGYIGIAYSAMIIIVYYLLTFINMVIMLPEERNPIRDILWLFNIMGISQILIAMFGGFLAVLINKRRIKRPSSVEST